MKELINMVDFVLEQDKIESVNSMSFYKVLKYANFLKQPLEIWQFVPSKLVDGVWVVLEEPDFMDGSYDDDGNGEIDKRRYKKELKEYQQAKEACIFEGFKVVTKEFNKTPYKFIQNKDTYVYYYDEIKSEWTKVNDYDRIKDLVLYNLQLTASAQKIIGL